MNLISRDYIVPAGTFFYQDYAKPDSAKIKYSCLVKVHVTGGHFSPDETDVWGVTELLEKPLGNKCSSDDYFNHSRADFLHLMNEGVVLLKPLDGSLEKIVDGQVIQ